jgi:hypothetical protein
VPRDGVVQQALSPPIETDTESRTEARWELCRRDGISGLTAREQSQRGRAVSRLN